ncbi:hypothetical protein ACQ9PO_003338, partial [Cronobacter sakazakii]
FLHSISNDDVTWYAMIIANSREDNAALAAARQDEAKPNNPPGCTISSLLNSFPVSHISTSPFLTLYPLLSRHRPQALTATTLTV